MTLGRRTRIALAGCGAVLLLAGCGAAPTISIAATGPPTMGEPPPVFSCTFEATQADRVQLRFAFAPSVALAAQAIDVVISRDTDASVLLTQPIDPPPGVWLARHWYTITTRAFPLGASHGPLRIDLSGVAADGGADVSGRGLCELD